MCYNARYLLEKALKRARYFSTNKDIEYYDNAIKEFDELHQVSGYSHPEVIIYRNDQPHMPSLSSWGLIPEWIKNEQDALNIRNKTLNARSETLFEKASFKDSARHKRCIIPVAGFYEHHHFKGRPYPFYISHNEDEPLNLAGIWSEWTNKSTGELINTCSIITSKANQLMTRIHNNPKLPEARMPVILPEGFEDEWLNPQHTEFELNQLKKLLVPYPKKDLNAHTVRRLSGKESLGNVPESSEKYEYEELEF